jgi:hypothetical protein
MSPAGQIRSFAANGEIIYQGTPVTGNWSGKNSDSQGGGVLCGTALGNDATLVGSPESSATMQAPDGTEFFIRMIDFFTWPAGTTVFFDYYVTGPAGNTVRVDSIGTVGQVLDPSFAEIVCDGSRQHVSGWSEVAFFSPWDDQNTFNMHFPAGGSAYTVDTFRAYIAPLILPVYGLSATGGTGASLIDVSDTASAAYLSDGSDSTVVVLDRQGTESTLAEIGDFMIDFFGNYVYFQEGTSFATRYVLDYLINDPTIMPDATKLLARTGGYTGGHDLLVATTVSAESRFGLTVDGVEKSIGALTASTVTGGELVVPEPPDPTSKWTWDKLLGLHLRMGYCDQLYPDSPNFAFLGMHAIGNKPARDYQSGGGGGIVAYAHIEALQLIPGYGPVSFSYVKTGQRRVGIQVR